VSLEDKKNKKQKLESIAKTLTPTPKPKDDFTNSYQKVQADRLQFEKECFKSSQDVQVEERKASKAKARMEFVVQMVNSGKTFEEALACAKMMDN